MPTNNHLPAGIQHIGHEGHWVGTSWCVHYINDNSWKWGCLKPQNNQSLSQRAHDLSPNFSYLLQQGTIIWGRVYRTSLTPSHVRSQARKRCSSSLALSTHQGLSDDCPRSRPGEHFDLPRRVNQHIPVTRKAIKEVLYLANAENIPSHKTPIIWLSKIWIISPHCQAYCPPIAFKMHTTFPQALFMSNIHAIG